MTGNNHFVLITDEQNVIISVAVTELPIHVA